jgi:hypothetical protein
MASCLWVAFFVVFLGSCNEVTAVLDEEFQQPSHKTIKIRDIDENWPAQISDIAGRDVLLTLTASAPAMGNFTLGYVESLTKFAFALGPVKGNAINLKLYSGTADYWTGSGNYWIVFVLPDKSLSTISHVYLSKVPHNIYAENTQLYNIDFMPPFEVTLDISGIMLF